MPQLVLPKTYADGNTPTEQDLNAVKSALETFCNSTKLDKSNVNCDTVAQHFTRANWITALSTLGFGGSVVLNNFSINDTSTFTSVGGFASSLLTFPTAGTYLIGYCGYIRFQVAAGTNKIVAIYLGNEESTTVTKWSSPEANLISYAASTTAVSLPFNLFYYQTVNAGDVAYLYKDLSTTTGTILLTSDSIPNALGFAVRVG